jgi:membrane-bound transcription factor site-1 protease
MPTILNATILNGMGVTGWLEAPPSWTPSGGLFGGGGGAHLDVTFGYTQPVLWPWTGYLALYLRVKESGQTYKGIAEGTVTFTVVSPPAKGETRNRRSTVTMSVKVDVIPTPPRRMRILWDNYHSIRYPPGYIPRDSLDVRQDILDWHGDHPHTNFHDMYDYLRQQGYYVEMLGSPFTCFDAENYQAVLLVDAEEEYHPEEVAKITDDINNRGLSLIVFADWYHVDTMVKMRFFDDNTRSWWTPATGGANVPALNDLLKAFGVSFGSNVLNGALQMPKSRVVYASGAPIVKFPQGGYLYSYALQDRTGQVGAKQGAGNKGNMFSVTGLLSPPGEQKGPTGRLAVHGDSNCLDSSHLQLQQVTARILLNQEGEQNGAVLKCGVLCVVMCGMLCVVCCVWCVVVCGVLRRVLRCVSCVLRIECNGLCAVPLIRAASRCW